MSFYLKFSVVFIIALLSSCIKEDPNFINADKIMVGDVQTLKICPFDTIVSPGHPHAKSFFELDIDGNGINDFIFSSYFTVSPSGFSDASEFKIKSLTDYSFINVIYYLDTTFFSTSIDTNYNDNKVYIVISDKYSCSRTGLNDSIISIDEKTIQTIKKEDTLSTADRWTTNSNSLGNGNIRSDYEIVSQISDTMVVHSQTYIFNCNPQFNNNEAYIGIKIEDLGRIKLGWIKLEISESYDVELVETAIQK